MVGYFTARLIWMGAGVNVDKPDNKWIELYILLSEIILGVVAGFFAAIFARFELLLVPLRAYFRQEYALVFLAFIILYKLGDVFAGGLITNFLLETVKFSLSEIGLVNKVFGLLATIVGAIVGGYLLKKIGLWRGLLIFGALQAITNLGYWWLALKGKGSLPNWIQFERADWMKIFLSQKAMKSADVIIQIDTGLLLAVFLENFAGGMGTIALVALMMALCSRKESTATQFALLSALSAIGRVYVTPTTPYLIDSWGWAHFFLFSMSAAIPALLMLFWMRRVVGDLDKAKA
jgi:PAT family beta-lactamase induction signal transducer AmpG